MHTKSYIGFKFARLIQTTITSRRRFHGAFRVALFMIYRSADIFRLSSWVKGFRREGRLRLKASMKTSKRDKNWWCFSALLCFQNKTLFFSCFWKNPTQYTSSWENLFHRLPPGCFPMIVTSLSFQFCERVKGFRGTFHHNFLVIAFSVSVQFAHKLHCIFRRRRYLLHRAHAADAGGKGIISGQTWKLKVLKELPVLKNII